MTDEENLKLLGSFSFKCARVVLITLNS